MIGVLTIARYEITRRWTLWLVALGLAVVPLLFTHWAFEQSRLAEALVVVSVGLSWSIAFVTGMTLVGRPLHDGQLSFYFTRPMRGSSIAAGKVLAGLAVVLGMELVLALPLRIGPALFDDSATPLFVAGMAIVFLSVGIVVGILARSRSRWFVTDALGASLVATLGVALFAALNNLEADVARNVDYLEALPIFHRIDLLLRGLVAAAVVAGFGAVIAAIAIGRTDRDRVHRALSFTLWPALMATALVGLAITRWGLR
jgi:hypothetical protein